MSVVDVPQSTQYPILSQEVLNAKAEFSLGDHELIDPPTNLGEVVSVDEIEAPEGISGDVRVTEIRVKDPFIAADPQGYEIVTRYIEGVIEPLGTIIGLDPFRERTEAQTLAERNSLTQAWLAGDNLRALSVWRENVPTALALDYLTNPNVDREVVSPDGSVAVSTPETAAHWRFVADAVGIRARKDAMATVTSDFLVATVKESKASWLSLASGTAEPSLRAAVDAMSKADFSVDMTVADWDGRALKVVQGKAKELEYQEKGGRLTTLRQNILTPDLAKELQGVNGIEQYDLVENMGFEEYLPQEGDTMQAYKSQGLPQASEFTARAFELVKPGGMLISGNMVLPRPQIGFVFGAVDWPVINARTEAEILRVYEEAGILTDPKAEVTMHRIVEDSTGLHIYNMVSVVKHP